MKLRLRLTSLILVLCLSAGCLPIPHTTERSPEIRGRVVDARTHAPVEGARIFLSGHPNITCTSDSAGFFRLKATRNFHFGSIPPEGDWPQRKDWGAAVTVSHTNYIDYVRHGPDDWRLTDKGDIALEPRH